MSGRRLCLNRQNRLFCAEPEGIVEGIGGPSIRWHKSSFDGSLQPYALYTPPSYDSSRSWPLVVSLHGYSCDHVLNLRRVMGRGNSFDEPDCEAKLCIPKLPDVDFIVASPYAFGSLGYQGAAEVDVLDVIADVRANFNIDEDMIYLTGLSMGGRGAWILSERYPDLFAAVAPVCGPVGFARWDYTTRPLPQFALDIFSARVPEAMASNLMHVPVKVFHGDSDEVVPVDHSRRMVELLRQMGCHVEYVEYQGVYHNSWDMAYSGGDLFRWFSNFRRVKKPKSVDFVTPSLRWQSAYWVRIEQIAERPKPARIRADILETAEESKVLVRVVTDNVKSFTLDPVLWPIEPNDEVVILWNGEEVFEGRVSEKLTFGDIETGFRKRAGIEGPVCDAFMGRHLIVYGAGGGRELANACREAAYMLADPGEWGDIDTPVKSCSHVTKNDISSYNLILIGNQFTSSLIRRVNNYLPVRFDGKWVQAGRRLYEGGDMGLIVIYFNPLNPERYVVVLGGHSPNTIMMAAENARIAPDYVVFDAGSDFSRQDTLLDWGFFDNSWGISR